ncbi:MAG: O-antigen ligase family protein [Acidobacteriota bacterium]
MNWLRQRLFHIPSLVDSPRRPGFWLFSGHLLSVWAIAQSNAWFGLTVLWSVRFRDRLRWCWQRASPLLLPLGLYTVFFMVSVITSLEPAISFEALKSLIGLGTLPLAILLVRGTVEVRRIIDLILIMMVLMACYGIGQYFFTDYGPLDNRIPGPFSHYMTFSGALLLGWFLVMGRLLTRGGSKQPLHWLALIVISATLLLTLTRGAWVAAGITFIIALLWRGRRHLPSYLAALAVATLLFLSFAPTPWKTRIASIADPRNESNYDRLSMLQAGLFMISESPLFGIGPGVVKHRYPIYRHPTAPQFKAAHLHNSFLQTAAERGLLSLGAYLWLMIAGLQLAYRGYRSEGGPHGDRADLYLGVMLAIFGFNLAGLFEANWRDTEIQRLMLFLLAIPLCLQAPATDPDSAPPSQAGTA